MLDSLFVVSVLTKKTSSLGSDIIRTLRTIVAEKNPDEAIQNFMYALYALRQSCPVHWLTVFVLHSYHTRKTSTPNASDLKNVSTGTNKEQMQQDGEEAVEHLRTLGKLIFTNSEARKLLKDIGLLGRDVAADGAAKLAEVARPDEDALRQIDEPAPSNQWVGPNGEKRDHNSSVPDTGLQEKKEQLQNARDQKDNFKQEMKDELKSRGENVANAADHAQQQQAGPATGHIGSARDAAQQGADAYNNSSSTGHYGSTGGNFHQGQPGQTLSSSQGGFSSAQGPNSGFSSTGGLDQQQKEEAKDRAYAGKEAGVGQAKEEAKGLKDKLLARVPDEHKDKADEQVQKAKVSTAWSDLLWLGS